MAAEDGQDDPQRELADLVRQLITATGLSLRQLARRTACSAQSWSAYQRNERPISPEALAALLEVPSAAPPALGERARSLLAQRQETRRPDGAAPRQPVAGGQPDPAPPGGPARQGLWQRGRRGAALAGALLVLGAGAGVGLTLLLRDHPTPRHTAGPSPTCGQSAQYTVTRFGHIVDEHKRRIDDVFPGDRFTRDDSSAHPADPNRYYGTVAGKKPGYVLTAKLARSGQVCD